jgi:hypothetical protein
MNPIHILKLSLFKVSLCYRALYVYIKRSIIGKFPGCSSVCIYDVLLCMLHDSPVLFCYTLMVYVQVTRIQKTFLRWNYAHFMAIEKHFWILLLSWALNISFETFTRANVMPLLSRLHTRNVNETTWSATSIQGGGHRLISLVKLVRLVMLVIFVRLIRLLTTDAAH